MRHLSEEQIPSEDKLQVKNLIYHSVKNALATLDKLRPIIKEPTTTTNVPPSTSSNDVAVVKKEDD